MFFCFGSVWLRWIVVAQFVMLVVQLVVLSMIGVGPGFVSLSSEEESVSVSSLLDIVGESHKSPP